MMTTMAMSFAIKTDSKRINNLCLFCYCTSALIKGFAAQCQPCFRWVSTLSWLILGKVRKMIMTLLVSLVIWIFHAYINIRLFYYSSLPSSLSSWSKAFTWIGVVSKLNTTVSKKNLALKRKYKTYSQLSI